MEWYLIVIIFIEVTPWSGKLVLYFSHYLVFWRPLVYKQLSDIGFMNEAVAVLSCEGLLLLNETYFLALFLFCTVQLLYVDTHLSHFFHCFISVEWKLVFWLLELKLYLSNALFSVVKFAIISSKLLWDKIRTKNRIISIMIVRPIIMRVL